MCIIGIKQIDMIIMPTNSLKLSFIYLVKQDALKKQQTIKKKKQKQKEVKKTIIRKAQSSL